MKLIRKEGVPVVTDIFGIEHPDIVIKITALPEDKLLKWLKIECAYFHNDVATQNLEMLGYSNFSFMFNSNTWEENGIVWETYTQVKQDISIDDNGNIILLNEDVPNWILNQPWVLDFEGKKFSENWKIVP
jgi:hypothetical protein